MVVEEGVLVRLEGLGRRRGSRRGYGWYTGSGGRVIMWTEIFKVHYN